MDKTALILVDIQNDYFPGGKMALHETEKAANNARVILDYFRDNNLPLFHIQHIFEDSQAPFFAADTEGVHIHQSVAPLENEPVIVKHFPNSFLHTSLEAELKRIGIKHVIIVGMMSHMCIDATSRAAVDLGFKCTVIEDACTCPDLTFNNKTIDAESVHYAYMAALESLYATIKTTDAFLDYVTN
ncbi:cysteine hydrolase family protein [Neobacillus kokaensis]|uniref:Isochorismatase family protein YddQ n=1 Tax=Neobacillus kokaensis TaxID=2759023 RepID=A0ABQ3N4S5_9BACI|nr:cysteine hydrolase family protein [Neobacillus kokaensis]GHH98617.1 putative isochorismatase family protein YddQ [Neobacillus kokaensis]